MASEKRFRVELKYRGKWHITTWGIPDAYPNWRWMTRKEAKAGLAEAKSQHPKDEFRIREKGTNG